MSDKLEPWWVQYTPDSTDDHTCVRCCEPVMVDPADDEWQGPDGNYHWNLCNDCAQELVIEMWERLQKT